MSLAEQIREKLKKTAPRAYSAVMIVEVSPKRCNILLGHHMGFVEEYRPGRYNIVCMCTNGIDSCQYTDANISKLRLSYTGIWWILRRLEKHIDDPRGKPSDKSFPTISSYLVTNDRTSWGQFNFDELDNPGLWYLEKFLRGYHETKSEIAALLPQPIAEEVIENYSP